MGRLSESMVGQWRRFWCTSASRYLLVAGSVSIFYLCVLSIGIVVGLHYLPAILVAQLIAIGIGFPIYRVFVFQSKGKLGSDLIRFLGVWVGGAIAGLVVTPLLVELFSWDPIGAQIFAIVTISALSYLAHRFFSFGSS